MFENKIGLNVSFPAHCGIAYGTIIGIKTEKFLVNGYTHHATKNKPQFVIKSLITEHISYHRPEILTYLTKNQVKHLNKIISNKSRR